MKKRIMAIAASAYLLGACATMDTLAGMGVISQHTSTFDHATVIDVSPNSLYAPSVALGTPLEMGASWSSVDPDKVALVFAYASNIDSDAPAFLTFSGLQVNIDGHLSNFQALPDTQFGNSSYNAVSRTVYTSSRNEVIVPYAFLKKMASATDCRLRIQTGQGYQDVLFSATHIPGGKPTAVVSIRRFIAKVDAERVR